MKIHHLTVEQTFATLRTGPNGLSPSEAQRRLIEYGRNEVPAVAGTSMAWRFLKEFGHFFALILWVAAFLAFLAEARQPSQGMGILGCAIVAVIVINGCFAFWQEYRAEKALAALQKLLPNRVLAKRSGETTAVEVTEIVPGDMVVLQAGDRVPADCRVVGSSGLRVNNATVTGESVPHSRNEEPSAEQDFARSSNVLLGGTAVVAGQASAVVFATGAHSVFGQIAHLTQSARDTLSPLQREIALMSRWIALLAVALGVLFFCVGRALGLPFWGNFIFAIGIIVANVPEGLLPTVTLALAMGAQRMAKRNAIVRHLPSIETLGSTQVICTDKTGTLTRNALAVTRLFVGGRFYTLPGIRNVRKLAEVHPGLFRVALACHNVKELQAHREVVGDPLEVALVSFAADAQTALKSERISELPFDSARRRMSVLCATQSGPVLFSKGAPEAILERCSQVEIDSTVVPLTPALHQTFTNAHQSMAGDGLRVLALAYRLWPEAPMSAQALQKLSPDELESGLTLCGFVGLEDPPRPEVADAVRKCRGASIKIIMITGDHPQTAMAVARQIGLVNSASATLITGDQLHHLSNTQLQLALDAPEIVFARVAADQKMRIVSALKRKKHIVAVTGDGVNDAPALRKADVGIAMGRTGTEVARESADIVLLDDNFATIVAAIEEGRAIYANIRKFLTYILTSNIPELIPYLAAVLFRIPLPLTIVQILAVDLGTDLVPALALGAEPSDPRTMKRPPRPRSERLLSWGLVARAYLWLGVMQAVAAMSAFFYVLQVSGWNYGQPIAAQDRLYLQATTACLSAIIIMQIANIFICRSERESVFKCGLFTNRLIWLGIAVESTLILLIDYTRWGNGIFGTAPIPLAAWLFVIPFGIGMLLLEECRKLVLRAKSS